MNNLNVNFNSAISRFESVMKRKLLIKNVLYKRIFGGKGFEFDSFRNYDIQDDSSLIDWRATMKNAGEPLVRQYVEERDLNVFILVDIGSNMIFGSEDKLKIETAVEISAALSHLILISGDKVGFALYSNKVSSLRQFSPGMQQFYYFVNKLSEIRNYGGKPDLKNCLEKIEPYLRKASAVFIVSDFINMDDETLKVLRSFMLRHETIGLMIRDSVDNKLADIKGEIVVEDIETGEQVLIDPDLINQEYEKHALEQKSNVENIFKKSGADLIELMNNDDFVVPLADFLKRRLKKRKTKLWRQA